MTNQNLQKSSIASFCPTKWGKNSHIPYRRVSIVETRNDSGTSKINLPFRTSSISCLQNVHGLNIERKRYNRRNLRILSENLFPPFNLNTQRNWDSNSNSLISTTLTLITCSMFMYFSDLDEDPMTPST